MSHPSFALPLSSQHFQICVVCGGSPIGERYGAMTCHGCIVFFRRAVTKGIRKKCKNDSTCEINYGDRSCCRSCRLKKCLKAGMNPEAIPRRDLIGPRQPKLSKISPTHHDLIENEIDFMFLLELQRTQQLRFQKFEAKIDKTTTLKIKHKLCRRATSEDVKVVMSMGFQNAIAWANHVESFRELDISEQAYVISEFGLAFVLFDQAIKTAYDAEKGFWLLQNNTFLHVDYFLKIPFKDTTKENLKDVSRCHFDFVSTLLNSLCEPIQNLQLDNLECIILKTLLLLTPSFPGLVQIGTDEKSKTKCITQLMKYLSFKYQEYGHVRFGEIILLISSIRCAVKLFCNHTKHSDLIAVTNLDSFTRRYFPS